MRGWGERGPEIGAGMAVLMGNRGKRWRKTTIFMTVQQAFASDRGQSCKVWVVCLQDIQLMVSIEVG